MDFYQDQPHVCSYVSSRVARNIYPDPQRPVTNQLYSYLIQHGFRRSGEHAYRPHCPDCQECVPVRININDFKANRNQRRCLATNKDLSIHIQPAVFKQEHYELYKRYLSGRHKGGGMDQGSQDNYMQFLFSEWSDTGFIEIRDKQQLLAVAVTDFVTDGASAFYTFFEPEQAKRSLGTFAILKQIALAAELGLSYLYLGYWIQSCKKMTYKSQFSALERYKDGDWQPLDKKTLNNQ